jgi:hypothetical protein
MTQLYPSRLTAIALAVAFLAGAVTLHAQVYSPRVTKQGQPDVADLKAMTAEIYRQANAATEREKAEAIWRFYLTDGRFVKPGIFYHIAGWAHEEPEGQVLDPEKLLNSYGFGLCYQVAPLLEATYDAGGFRDSRVWFLTGHTVAEVFYDGAYHYFDSDMMGYNPIGSGPLKLRPVASVHQIEQDGNIILKKEIKPGQADPSAVDYPWYPADVRAHAIPDLAELFTTTSDNYVYPLKRYPQGHEMSFVLRPGERIIRYFQPEPPGVFYLPYQYDGSQWQEVPQEIKEYNIKTADGPHSQKDARTWATGKVEYRPPADVLGTWQAGANSTATLVLAMPCPFVVIDAAFDIDVALPTVHDALRAETSTDGGASWVESAPLAGPFSSPWKIRPARLTQSAHGERNAVSGTYGYLFRLTYQGGGKASAAVRNLLITTVFQHNPRTLPALAAGKNELEYQAAREVRREVPVRLDQVDRFAHKVTNATYAEQSGQGFIVNEHGSSGELIFSLADPQGLAVSGFDVGGRFLDLRNGLAPDKFTAEVRKVEPWPTPAGTPVRASLSWSTKPDGPWQTLWTYDDHLKWLDGQAIDRTLRWPEVDKSVRSLPRGTRRVYVRYSIDGMAIDSLRMAVIREVGPSPSALRITHVWKDHGQDKEFTHEIPGGSVAHQYFVNISGDAISNEALIMECPAAVRSGP